MWKPVFEICLTCKHGHNKFWNGGINFDPTATSGLQWIFEAKYGVIGTSGRASLKQCPNIQDAVNNLLKKIKEKGRKKYMVKSIVSLDLSAIPEIVSKKTQLATMLEDTIRLAFGLSASWKLPLLKENSSNNFLGTSILIKEHDEKTVAEIMRERAKNAPVII